MVIDSSGGPLVNKNMPAVAGGLNWAQQLQQRIQTPFSKFRHLYYPWVYFSYSQYNRLWILLHDDHPSAVIIAQQAPLNASWTDVFRSLAPGKISDKSFAWLLNCILLFRCLETPDGVRVLQKYEVMMQWLDRWLWILKPITPNIIMLRYIYSWMNMQTFSASFNTKVALDYPFPFISGQYSFYSKYLWLWSLSLCLCCKAVPSRTA